MVAVAMPTPPTVPICTLPSMASMGTNRLFAFEILFKNDYFSTTHKYIFSYQIKIIIKPAVDLYSEWFFDDITISRKNSNGKYTVDL